VCGGVIHSVAKENCITATAFEPKSRLAEDMAPATTAVRWVSNAANHTQESAIFQHS